MIPYINYINYINLETIKLLNIHFKKVNANLEFWIKDFDLKNQETQEIKKIETSDFTKEVENCFLSCLRAFPDNLHPKTPKTIFNWKNTIKKLNEIDMLPFETIENVVFKTRADDFWAKNFLSIPKLRAKNKEQIKYIVVFNEQIKSNGTSNRTNQEIFTSAAESELAADFKFS